MTAKKLSELTGRRGFKKYEQNPSLSVSDMQKGNRLSAEAILIWTGLHHPAQIRDIDCNIALLVAVAPFALKGEVLTSKEFLIKRISNKTGDRCMIISKHGEILAPAGFHEIVEVDKTQFVKLYVNGVKAFQGLSSAGTKVFELVYCIVQEKPSVDKIYIHFMNIDQARFPLSERTFHRGLTELLSND